MKSVRDAYRWLESWLRGTDLVASAAVLAISTVVTTSVAIGVILWLPADHFARHVAGRPRPQGLRWLGHVLRNVVGVLVLLFGVLLLVLPGPGLVFMLVGVSLLDFPGKQRLERKLLQVRSVLPVINRVRARFHRPPLQLDCD